MKVLQRNLIFLTLFTAFSVDSMAINCSKLGSIERKVFDVTSLKSMNSEVPKDFIFINSYFRMELTGNRTKSEKSFASFVKALSKTSFKDLFIIKNSEDGTSSINFPGWKALVTRLSEKTEQMLKEGLPVSKMEWKFSRKEMTELEQLEYFSKNGEFVMSTQAQQYAQQLKSNYFSFLLGPSLNKRLQRLAGLWLELRKEIEKDYLKEERTLWLDKAPNGPKGVRKITVSKKDVQAIDQIVMSTIQVIQAKSTKLLLESKLTKEVLEAELGPYTSRGLNGLLLDLVRIGSNDSVHAMQYGINFIRENKIENWKFDAKVFDKIIEESHRNLNSIKD